MIGGGRHRNRIAVQRRFRKGREQAFPWLILIVVAGIAVLVAVLLGNFLLHRTETLTPADRTIPGETTGGQIRVPDVRADAFALGYAVTGMTENGTVAVSVNLRDADDTLTYRSAAAIHMGRQTDGAVTISAVDEVAYLHENNVYVCGIFRVLSPTLDGEARTAEEYYEASLLSELGGTGIDAILIDGLSFSPDNADASLDCLARFRAAAPNTAIGIVLPLSAFGTDNAQKTLRSYLRICDFFCADLRGEAVSDALIRSVNEGIYNIRAFPVRFLISREEEEIRSLLGNASYNNLQIVP